MENSTTISKLLAAPIMFVALFGSVACSTTTVEAPKPVAVTVVSPTAWVAPTPMGNIPAVATGAGKFNTLLAAIRAAELDATLNGAGPFTVFAPTDAAFDKLPAATLQRLLRPENRAALRQLVSYHVISGRVPSSGLMGKTMTSPTVEGGSVSIEGHNGVMINNSARVIQADIEANNGLIHAIDTVLMPPDLMALR
jgi:uncharacterized surface protein with fasciclin (FAS1) repeats